MDLTSYLLGKKSGGGSEYNLQDTKTVTITENTTTEVTPDTGYDAIKKVQVTTNVSGSGIDWSTIGYSETPFLVSNGYNIAKNLHDNWDSSITSLNGKWYDDWNMIIMPLVDTSHVTNWNYAFKNCPVREIPALNTSSGTNFSNCFDGCTYLQILPIFDFSEATQMANMFLNCPHIKNASVDNLLVSLTNVPNYTGTKTLSYLGFKSTYHKATTIQGLPHYQDFVNAGWSIGY